ncbi:MAG: energy-coupling factor transporter ATPase [Firmicutes bacterium]|nr:energy-coupling factor transporter ATPase [Bacillota bacterium]
MIKAKELVFEYASYDEDAQRTQVLQGIDMSVAKGEFIAIVGCNGSGKSTLARHFNALLTPTGGTLWIDGKDTKDAALLWDVRQQVGMLFQNPDNQIVASIVDEDVAFGPENLGVPSDEIRHRVDNALSAVGMTEYAASSSNHLSGGQKQRIGIAGVLAMVPDCIVLDEPTAMLDPSGRKEVLDAVSQLNREMGITVILITHFMEEAARAGRIMVIDKGNVVMNGTPRDVFSQVEEMRNLGLSVPQVTVLAHELRVQGLPIDDTILTVDEFLQNPVIKGLTV